MISLENLRKEDIPFLIKIMEENDDSTRDDAKEWYLKSLKKGYTNDFVIKLDSKTIGIIGYRKWKNRAVLTWFHISKKYHERGYGSKALLKLEKLVSKNNISEIQADTGYSKAIDFYKKNGYKIVRIIPHYFPKGSSKTTLRKEIE